VISVLFRYCLLKISKKRMDGIETANAVSQPSFGQNFSR